MSVLGPQSKDVGDFTVFFEGLGAVEGCEFHALRRPRWGDLGGLGQEGVTFPAEGAAGD